MQVAVAAGHPATADAGLEILAEGGTAADAAVAATLASCVAETLMTGLLGGGHAIYWDAAEERAQNLDFFVSVPGLGGDGRERHMEQVGVPFGEELIHYAIGPATCGSRACRQASTRSGARTEACLGASRGAGAAVSRATARS